MKLKTLEKQKLNLSCCAPLHTKTRVSLKYPVGYCTPAQNTAIPTAYPADPVIPAQKSSNPTTFLYQTPSPPYETWPPKLRGGSPCLKSEDRNEHDECSVASMLGG